MRAQYRRQLPLALGDLTPVEQAVRQLAGIEAQGAIYTRREVVEFILDLVGYTADKPLHEFRLLEPSIGGGDFLFPALQRLLIAYRRSRKAGEAVFALKDAVRAVELNSDSYNSTRDKLLEFLHEEGFKKVEAKSLADEWLQQGDFLLTTFSNEFSHIVGNPPYVRQESIPDILMEEYRRRFSTIYDRADIYVPFIEHSLSMLATNGKLAFICADRWMKNKYGRPLRKLVSAHYHFETYVDMVDTPAFLSDVMAYPAIVVLSNQKPGQTRVAHRPTIEERGLSALASALTAQGKTKHDAVQELPHLAHSDEPWALTNFEQVAIVRKLEAQFPAIEGAGCRVGIGVATGADRVFVAPFDDLDVEDDRKLPLVMTRDIKSGTVEWRGLGVLNPFNDDGSLVNLKLYPRFAKYIKANGEEIRRRHVSKKNPENWYRTIDRIYPALTSQPKLLIPDIKGAAHIVYESGKYYPHHNLYFVTSEDWDLRALQAVLSSRIGLLFIETYSTRMRGGYLRFQAQYIRRIRIPLWKSLSRELQKELISAGKSLDADRCNDAAFRLYGLTTKEREVLGT